MNRDEMARLLRSRSALTSQPYGDDTIDAWFEVLQDRQFGEAKVALLQASRSTKRITVADVIEQMTPPRTSDHPAGNPIPYCARCEGCGWRSVSRTEAHYPRTCHPTEEHPCDCSAVRPCECTTGRKVAASGVHGRIVEHNDRERYRGPIVLPPSSTPDEPTRLELATRLDL